MKTFIEYIFIADFGINSGRQDNQKGNECVANLKVIATLTSIVDCFVFPFSVWVRVFESRQFERNIHLAQLSGLLSTRHRVSLLFLRRTNRKGAHHFYRFQSRRHFPVRTLLLLGSRIKSSTWL